MTARSEPIPHATAAHTTRLGEVRLGLSTFRQSSTYTPGTERARLAGDIGHLTADAPQRPGRFYLLILNVVPMLTLE